MQQQDKQDRLFAPGAKTPPALDVGKVVLDRDAVEAGAEILVEAGHSQLRGDQLLRGNGPAARQKAEYDSLAFYGFGNKCGSQVA